LPPGSSCKDVGAGDVHGHQVRRELDAAEAEATSSRRGADEQRLGKAGDSHQQRVTTGEEADRELLDDLVLADDDFFELIAEAAVNLAEFINGGDVVLRKRGVGHANFMCAHEWHQKRGVLTRTASVNSLWTTVSIQRPSPEPQIRGYSRSLAAIRVEKPPTPSVLNANGREYPRMSTN
jgi:hypothetical protein